MRGVIPVVAVLLLLLAGCDNSNDAEKAHQATHAGTPQTSTAPAKVGTLESQTQSLTQVAEGCSGDDCPQVSIQWPEYVGQPALNKAIHQRLVAQLASSRPGQPAPTTLKGAAEAFMGLASSLPDEASRGWQLTGKATQLARRGNLLTLEISSYEFTGGAHGMPATHWLNWDLAAAKPVSLSDLIQSGKLKAFWDLARQAHVQWLKNEAEADDDFRQAWPFQKTDDYRLTAKGVVLLYQVYSIAPYVMGEPQLLVPWEQAKPLVRQAYLADSQSD